MSGVSFFFYCRSRARSRSLSRFDDKQELMKLLLLRSKCTPLVMKLQPGPMRDATAEKTALSIFASVARPRGDSQAKITWCHDRECLIVVRSLLDRRKFSMSDVCFLYLMKKLSFPLKLNKRRFAFFSICFHPTLIAPFFSYGSFRR